MNDKPKVAPEIIVGLEGRPLCKACGRPIEASYKSYMGEPYHPECYALEDLTKEVADARAAAAKMLNLPEKILFPEPRETLDETVRRKAGMPTPGRKDDSDKARWDLLPFGPLSDVVAVLTYGARKYAPDNWQHVENPRSRYLAAALRHIVAWQEGERLDSESGHPHLAHATCCLLFAAWFDRE